MESIKINKVDIPVKEQEFTDCNILKAIVGTTGWQKGKWDCRTYFALVDEACTNMHGEVLESRDGIDTKMVATYFEGETELITLMCALKFSLDTLVEKAKETIPGFDLDRAYEARTKDYSADPSDNPEALPF